ncbi:MAG: hypothetical protein ACYSWZ_11975 [Planctomycetota bacterium]
MKNVKENSEKHKDAAVQFLEADFNQCFQQMRHYETCMLSICKFSFLGYSTMAGASLGLYKLGIEQKVDLKGPASMILIMGLILGLLLFWIVVRNRVYFVKVARYINEMRALFLELKPMGFENKSQMYHDYTKPVLNNPLSSQIWLCYVVAFLNSILLGALLYIHAEYTFWNYSVLIGLPFIICLIQVISSVFYLKSIEDRSEGNMYCGKEKEVEV